MAEMRNESDLSTSEEDSDRVTAPPPKKQKIYKQKYNKKWEKDPLLKSWILPVKTHCHKAYCDFVRRNLLLVSLN